eukprot:3722178-Rhodomonas_salina.2
MITQISHSEIHFGGGIGGVRHRKYADVYSTAYRTLLPNVAQMCTTPLCIHCFIPLQQMLNFVPHRSNGTSENAENWSNLFLDFSDVHISRVQRSHGHGLPSGTSNFARHFPFGSESCFNLNVPPRPVPPRRRACR